LPFHLNKMPYIKNACLIHRTNQNGNVSSTDNSDLRNWCIAGSNDTIG
jgi:hypothetical protein